MSTESYINRKTPGVYTTEFDAFPTSIVGVETAVPAFIGYTQFATASGKTVIDKPVPISSMADYELYFGGAPNPQYGITETIPGQTPDISVAYPNATGGKAALGYSVTPAAASPYRLYYSMHLFFANGGSNCYVVSVGNYEQPISKMDLIGGLEAVDQLTGPTMLVVPDAVSLPSDGTNGPIRTSSDFNAIVQHMIQQAGNRQDRVAILDIYDAPAVTHTNTAKELDPCIDSFKAALTPIDPGSNLFSYGVAYFPWLNTTIVSPEDIDYTFFAQQPIGTLNPPISPAPASQFQQILTLFNMNQNPQDGAVDTPAYTAIQKVIDGLDLGETDSAVIASSNNTLINALPQYPQLLRVLSARLNVLPPSGAMAGVYTLSDADKGVWNAPANMNLIRTLSPTINLDAVQQGGLNVPVDGFAVDVIRYFTGQGTVVWGARTLDGNSQDWRYIQVRRMMIFIEQSIKQALNPYVFAPNEASTWNAVVQVIDGFLQDLWSKGGLKGSSAADAYTVQCGLGATMTATDVLNGIMNVAISVAVVHPAEFIELSFQQQMQS